MQHPLHWTCIPQYFTKPLVQSLCSFLELPHCHRAPRCRAPTLSLKYCHRDVPAPWRPAPWSTDLPLDSRKDS
ncbi:hypothetical protein E2C01_059183 [Portunus trituberculatus]|uniref:Uncharacterized protein n=1 Tax=Portunus trituberculatus TaxID=210409 RepID=A0A5B7H5E1_PORTR|nr:hypothetical protein [Portunus trituberculatus]